MNRKNLIMALISIFYLNPALCYSAEQRTDQEISMVVVGLPEKNQKSFLSELKISQKKFEHIRRARKLIQAKKHQQALVVLTDAMQFVNPQTLDSAPVRRLMLDVYEGLGDLKLFGDEINWLIDHTKNPDSKKALIDRKARVLAAAQ